jgi:hypothetical protein
MKIYGTFLQGHLKKFSEGVQELSTKILQAALALHERVATTFRKSLLACVRISRSYDLYRRWGSCETVDAAQLLAYVTCSCQATRSLASLAGGGAGD